MRVRWMILVAAALMLPRAIDLEPAGSESLVVFACREDFKTFAKALSHFLALRLLYTASINISVVQKPVVVPYRGS